MVRTALGLLVLSTLPAAADDRPVVVIQKQAYTFDRVERTTRFPDDLVFERMKRPQDAPAGQEYVVLRFHRLHQVDGYAPPESESLLTSADDGVSHPMSISTTRCQDGRCWGGLTFLVPRGAGYTFSFDGTTIEVPAEE